VSRVLSYVWKSRYELLEPGATVVVVVATVTIRYRNLLYRFLDFAPAHRFTDPGSRNMTLDVGKDSTAWQFARTRRDGEGATITCAASMRQDYSSAHSSLLVGRAINMKGSPST
jgi:hypothetical protein